MPRVVPIPFANILIFNGIIRFEVIPELIINEK